MTKAEREALVKRAADLDLVQAVLSDGSFSGKISREVTNARAFIYNEWQAIQVQLQAETERINSLLEGEKKPKEEAKAKKVKA